MRIAYLHAIRVRHRFAIDDTCFRGHRFSIDYTYGINCRFTIVIYYFSESSVCSFDCAQDGVCGKS